MNEDHEKRLDHFQNQFNFSNTDFTPTIKDLDIFTEICQIVSNRAARLAAAAMVSLIEQQQDDLPKEDDIVIGVNGSTYEKYPRMHERILESLHDWFGPELGNRIKLEVATDGGSIGGALIAMLAEKQQKQAEKEKRFVCENKIGKRCISNKEKEFY
jgi:hexokinase